MNTLGKVTGILWLLTHVELADDWSIWGDLSI